MDALRADQWLREPPRSADAQRAQIKQQMRDAFYTDTDDWKQRIVEQARRGRARRPCAGWRR